MKTKRYRCTTATYTGGTESLIDAETAAKARYLAALRLSDIWPDTSIFDIMRSTKVVRDDSPTDAEYRLAQATAACDRWNEQHPVGTRVQYWRMTRSDPPSGIGPTRSPAYVLGGHTPVVLIEGCSGSIHLTHVEPWPFDVSSAA